MADLVRPDPKDFIFGEGYQTEWCSQDWDLFRDQWALFEKEMLDPKFAFVSGWCAGLSFAREAPPFHGESYEIRCFRGEQEQEEV